MPKEDKMLLAVSPTNSSSSNNNNNRGDECLMDMEYDEACAQICDDVLYNARQSNWMYVHSRLDTDIGNSLLCNWSRSNGSTLLHEIIKLNVPAHVFTRMVDAFPRALTRSDEYERNLLHLAVIHAAPLECIQLVLKRFPIAAIVSDVWGKVPLHYAVELGCKGSKQPTRTLERKKQHSKYWVQIATALLNAAPQALHVTDLRNKSPLELVGEEKEHCVCYSALQAASKKYAKDCDNALAGAGEDYYHQQQNRRRRGSLKKAISHQIVKPFKAVTTQGTRRAST